MRPEPLTNLNDAKRSLGREVRMLEGFIGVGIGGTDIIRLYVKDRKTPVVRYKDTSRVTLDDGQLCQPYRAY